MPTTSTPWNDNGILGRVPGDRIAAGMRQLPAPGDAEEGPAHALVEVPELGLVRITYQRTSSRRGKWRHHFWVAVHAEVAEEGC